jgi:CheY-like chemotaxis protein
MLRILIVDDDPMVSQTMQLWLRRQGFDVVTADGAASGLSALSHGDFDLMIIDIFMPHMHGFESVQLFHRSAPAVPLIAMSGYALRKAIRRRRTFCAWRWSWAPRAACASHSSRAPC